MGETGIAALFITLAVVIVWTGPARLLQILKALSDGLRGARRAGRGGRRKAAARE